MKELRLKEITRSMQLGENAIRVFIDEKQVLWMPAKQVVEALGKGWSGQALDFIPAQWRLNDKIIIQDESGISQMREVVLINSRAFQRLLHRSDHPNAIEYCNQLADFEDKLRIGIETKQDIENLRQSVQLTFAFFTGIKEQREVNHKWNLSPKKVTGAGQCKPPNALYWNSLYKLFFGMNKAGVALWLKDRFDIPQHILDNSGIEKLH